MINAWQWEKSKAIAFPACKCKSRLNFLVRGQFEINILKVLLMNTTYFIWACDHLKSIKYQTLELSGSIPEPSIRSGDAGQQRHYFDSCQLIKTLMSNMCALSVFLCSQTSKRSSKTVNWSADSFQINHVTSMSWHMTPRYSHRILVSGHPVLTAVNWPYRQCPI